MLRLIKLWLKAPIEERGGNRKRRKTGGKGNSRGTPQGGAISPLLANSYMNRFVKYCKRSVKHWCFSVDALSGSDGVDEIDCGHDGVFGALMPLVGNA